MSSTWGERIKLSIFGESHGGGIGVVIDGLPDGEPLDEPEIMAQMARRAPGNGIASTARKEKDEPEIVSGIFDGKTTGAPLCAVIRNGDAHSGDYASMSRTPRPGHADYSAFMRYHGHADYRGGGHFSGRLTAPLTFAGAVCRQILARRGVEIAAHLLRVGKVTDAAFDMAHIDPLSLRALSQMTFPTLETSAGEAMTAEIEDAKQSGDSVGGVVECAAAALPAGLGSPIFGGVENRLSSLLFGIPAVKGVEFGNGFDASALRGSENNDPFRFAGGKVVTETNRHGGVLGGITTGMPLIFRAALKPTPSIFRPQRTVDLVAGGDTELVIKGRHDPCIAVRAVPVIESAAAVCLLDLYMEAYGNDIG